MKKILYILTTEPFPNGLAATNRLLSYIELIVRKGIIVKVWVLSPIMNSNDLGNYKSKGTYNGIDYEYLHGYTTWPDNVNKIYKIKSYIKSLRLLKNILKTNRPNSVLLITNVLIYLFYIQVLCKKLHLNVFQEKTEYPHYINKNNLKLKICFSNYLYRRYSGMLVITYELAKFFKKLGQNNIFILPMTVNADHYKVLLNETTEKKYIAYCGGGNYQRDGVLDTIVAYNKSSINKELDLMIIGPENEKSEYYNKLRSIANNSQNNIIFTGRMKSQDVPQLLKNADCLILTPNKDFESGGFPTKLGEYLATGNPVICTAVSEIPRYLNDSNSLIVEPGNIMMISEKMNYLIEKPKLCKEIGEKGKLLAESVFNPKKYINDLMIFLGTI